MRRQRWGRTAVTVCLAASVGASVAASSPARASVPDASRGGRYTIQIGQHNRDGLPGESWSSFNESGGRLKVGDNGYGAYYVKGTINDDPQSGDRAGWRLTAPPGLRMRTASLDAFWDVGVAGRWISGMRYSITARDAGGTAVGDPLVTCETTASDNPCADRPFAANSGTEYPLPSNTSRLELAAECVAEDGCRRFGHSEYPGGNEYAAVAGATVTLEDLTPPVLGVGAGELWSDPDRWFHNGEQALTVMPAQDNSGISRMRWYVDGVLAYDTSGITSSGALACNFAYFRPCSAESARFDLERSLFAIPDGTHDLTAVASDAAGNVSQSATRRFRVDDAPPPAPEVSVREGSAFRDPGPWHLDFEVPGDGGGSRARDVWWRFCALSDPTDCTSPDAAAGALAGSAPGDPASIAVTPPRQGEWTVELWLADEAGNVSDQNASEPVVIRYGESAPEPDPQHPPSLSGEWVDGGRVSVSASGFDVSGTPRYGFQWQRCSAAGTDCEDVVGATRQEYTLGHADAGHRMRARVTATNGKGTASALSSASPEVAFLAPRDGVAALTGTMRAGATVRIDGVRFGGTPPFDYAYRWLRCGSGVCDPIEGANGDAYVLGDEDVGQTVRAIVTASNRAGSADAEASGSGSDGDVVRAAPPHSVAAPEAPAGSLRVGLTLTAADGEWSGTRPMHFSYSWQRCAGPTGGCTTIAGATSRTLELVDADAGRVLRVLVSASNEGNGAVGPVASGRTGVVEAAEREEEDDSDGDGGGGGGTAQPGPAPAAPPAPAPSQPAAPPEPAVGVPVVPLPTPTVGEPDLSKIPGNLVAASTCKVVRANPRSRSASLRGIGRVKLSALVPARVLAGAPLTLSLAARKGKVRSVTYRLAGRKVGRAKRRPFTARVKPKALRLGARQPLVAAVLPRKGRARAVRMSLDVGECPSLLTAAVRFSGARAITRVRAYSRFSQQGGEFVVPAALVPRPKAGKKAGTLRLTGLAGRKLVAPLVAGRGGSLLTRDGLTVKRRGRKLVVGGVPAGFGIAELDLLGRRRTALKALHGRKPLRFTAKLRVAGLPLQRLAATVRPVR